MKLFVILLALAMLCIILLVVAAVINSPTLAQYAAKGLLISIIGFAVTVFIGVVTIGVCTPNNEPTALDVYRGKTILEITYRDSVAVDSVVVYKIK